MDAPFLQRLEASKYGCLTEVNLELTRFHALIGPNDSGKSTILNAARTLANLLEQVPIHPQLRAEIAPGLFSSERGSRLALKTSVANLEVQGVGTTWFGTVQVGAQRSTTKRQSGNLKLSLQEPLELPTDPVTHRNIFKGARLVRLDPDALKEPSTLIPETEHLRLLDERGHGLAGVYDAILNRGDNSFHRIVDDLKRLFPTIRGLRLSNVSTSTKILQVELTSGELVPAQYMSEGLLYYLAFATIGSLEPTSLLLIEEPENGLHPARIAEVMKALREISKTTQVLIATHSPLVVNELSGEEVTVVTRVPDRGTETRRLSETPNFEERSKVYAPGELWLSYANGTDEKDLLSAPQP